MDILTGVKIAGAMVVVVSSGLIGYRLGTYQELHNQLIAQQEKEKEVKHETDLKETVLTKYVYITKKIYVKVDPIIKEVQVEVEKPIYQQCVIPESGRVLLNDAIHQANSALIADGAM